MTMTNSRDTLPADATKLGQPLPLPAFVLLIDVALACLMATRPPSMVRIGGALLLIGLNLYGAAAYTAGAPEDDYGLGSSVWGPTTLSVVLFTWLIPNPMQDIRFLQDPTPLTEKPLLTRIYYAVCIHHNWRLIGTNVQVANLPPPFTGTRMQFITRRLRQICVGLAVLDIAETFLHSHHHLYVPGANANGHLPPGFPGYLGRSACMAVWLIITYSVLNLSYCVLSLSAVATTLWKPDDWPDMFGSLSDAYTVRRSWGHVWHQLLRRHFSRWGKVAARALGAPRGSFLSAHAQVHGAFAASAVLHSIADLAIGHSPRHLGHSAAFFLLNGAAVTLEGAVIALARRAGVRGPTRVATRVLGYAWVAVWFTWAARFYQDPLYAAGIGHGPTLPYSPTKEIVVPFIRRATGL